MTQPGTSVLLTPRKDVIVLRIVFAIVLSLAAIGLFCLVWMDPRRFPIWSDSGIVWPNYWLLRPLLVTPIIAMAGVVYGLVIASVTWAARIRIEDGRIMGSLLRLYDCDIDIEIDDLFYIGITRRVNARIGALELIHPGGSDVLKGFSNLEAALDAILEQRPQGIEVFERRWFPVPRSD